MKRFVQLGCVGLAATAMFTTAPFTGVVASAQTVPPTIQRLNLTSDQKAQLQKIFQDVRQDIENILTPEQQAQFRAAYRELQDFRAAMAGIDNLTNAQKARLRAVMQESRRELKGVLTAEQQAELRSMMQRRHLRRR